jgi:hypothetical protein
MRAAFIVTSTEMGTWLSEVTHPFWHLNERGFGVDFASPAGSLVRWTPRSDPHFEGSEKPAILSATGSCRTKGCNRGFNRRQRSRMSNSVQV